MIVELTVPSCAIVCEISLISSSSISVKSLPACSSPSDSTNTAARSGPERDLKSSLTRLIGGSSSRALVHPAAEDRDRLLRVLVDDLADLLDRGGADAALDAVEVDHLLDRLERLAAARGGKLGGQAGGAGGR